MEIQSSMLCFDCVDFYNCTVNACRLYNFVGEIGRKIDKHSVPISQTIEIPEMFTKKYMVRYDSKDMYIHILK